MAPPEKNPNPADLIAIANPKLAQKLDKAAVEIENKVAASAEDTENQAAHRTYKQDQWKAVTVLNLLRYALALFLIALLALNETSFGLKTLSSVTHLALFQISVFLLLVSAICFTVFTKTRKFPLSSILITQFAIDVLLAGMLMHASGSISSNFSLLFFVIVTTGSVVLRRKNAIALASGATIVLFYEHFYSILGEELAVEPHFDRLALYCVLLMVSGVMISYLAQRLRVAEMKSFDPDKESIEDFLIREEKAALKSALDASDGNKTEAAKLIGMTFRSFRYKLTKYDIA